jgi:hypothetical protein
MEHEQKQFGREVEALENCRQQYFDLFGEEMPTGPLMNAIYSVANEKWQKFAKARIEHLTIPELERLLNLIMARLPMFPEHENGLDDLPKTILGKSPKLVSVKKKKDAEKEES